jgi:hypothetical protein
MCGMRVSVPGAAERRRTNSWPVDDTPLIHRAPRRKRSSAHFASRPQTEQPPRADQRPSATGDGGRQNGAERHERRHRAREGCRRLPRTGVQPALKRWHPRRGAHRVVSGLSGTAYARRRAGVAVQERQRLAAADRHLGGSGGPYAPPSYDIFRRDLPVGDPGRRRMRPPSYDRFSLCRWLRRRARMASARRGAAAGSVRRNSDGSVSSSSTSSGAPSGPGIMSTRA